MGNMFDDYLRDHVGSMMQERAELIERNLQTAIDTIENRRSFGPQVYMLVESTSDFPPSSSLVSTGQTWYLHRPPIVDDEHGKTWLMHRDVRLLSWHDWRARSQMKKARV